MTTDYYLLLVNTIDLNLSPILLLFLLSNQKNIHKLRMGYMLWEFLCVDKIKMKPKSFLRTLINSDFRSKKSKYILFSYPIKKSKTQSNEKISFNTIKPNPYVGCSKL